MGYGKRLRLLAHEEGPLGGSCWAAGRADHGNRSLRVGRCFVANLAVSSRLCGGGCLVHAR